MIGAALWLLAAAASAHEVQPSVADVEVTEDRVVLEIVTAVEPLIAGIDLSEVEDTDQSPLADRNDRLRALPPEALSEALEEAWPLIAPGLTIRAGDQALAPELAEIEIPPVGDIAVRRDSRITVEAALPDDGSAVTIAWATELGGLVVRQGEGETGYEAFLTGGASTEPLPRDGAATATLGQVVARYLVSGFDHIIPQGLDHILFVLGLFFYALAWRPLLWQVTAFTLAHTATLALASLGIVRISPAIVEPLIALSIVWIAVENILAARRAPTAVAPAGRGRPATAREAAPVRIGWTRIAVVFGFGLLHGLGFASVLAEFGLGRDFVASLVSFNVGVELGQLAVIAFAALLVGLPFGREPWYRTLIANPASGAIGAVGFYWFLERTILA